MDTMTKEIRHLLTFASKEKGWINEEDHSINFIISTDKLDRHKEIVEVAAIEKAIPQFADNPCCLACHQHRLITGISPVIGSWDTSTFKAFKHHSEMRLVFAVDTELGENYWKLYKARHMRAVSIGFIPQEWREEKDDKNGRHWIHTALELIEIACIPVGANRQALAKLKEYFQIDHSKDMVQVDQLVEAALNNLKTEILDHIDEKFKELSSVILDGKERAAGHQLGNAFDLPDPAVNQDKAEQKALDIIQNELTKIDFERI